MRRINLGIIHCSATKEGQEFTREQIKKMHLKRGFSDIGYHFLVMLDGSIVEGRDISRTGAHVKGHNTGSIGVCYIGGLDSNGKPKDTRTPEQKESLRKLTRTLSDEYNFTKWVGHRDLSPDKNKNGIIEKWEWMKACPCFDVKTQL